jgi:DNA-binding PadR family transcriptional regulator
VLVLQPEKDLKLKERCVKAFLDFVILRFLAKKPLTGYEVNHLLVKNYGVMIAPNTINSKLSAMERRGWTSVVRNRHGKTYSLTAKGQETVNNLPAVAAETHAFIRIVFGS